MKNRFLLGLSLLFCGSLAAQNFQTTLSRSQTDFNHYSIETSPNGEYILAGTLFGPSGNDIHIIKMDQGGNVICEQTLDLSPDDRALDITEMYGQIVVTGYTIASGVEELLVAKFDDDCACNSHVAVQGHPYSVGTNIIWSDNTQSLFVGGLVSNDPIAVPLVNNGSVVIEFDQFLGKLNETDIYGNNDMHSSVNDIIETPNGLFVTGALGANGSIQGVMAVFLDYGLGYMSDVSFESTNSEHVGVSAVYEDANDRIYLLSNNSAVHNPQINHIDDVSGGPLLGTSYFLALDPSYGQTNAAGFELRESVFDPDNLVAVGYFRTHDFGSAPYNNATPWIAEFDKNSGANVQTMLYQSNSTNFHTHGGGVLSTFSGEHPYVFNSEILTLNLEEDGYVFISPRLVNGEYSLDVINSDFNVNANDCLSSYSWDAYSITNSLESTSVQQTSLWDTDYPTSCSDDLSDVGSECPFSEPCEAKNFQKTIARKKTDHNHYSIETVDECSYIMAGTEFKDNGANNDIHVLKFNFDGTLLWERFIDMSKDDRALDIAEDADGNFIVVGYTVLNGVEQIYMVKYDANGNCLGDIVVDGLASSAGTNVIYSENNGTYIVGAMTAGGGFSYPLTGSFALVMEFTTGLVSTGNPTVLHGPAERHASINDIVEVPNGFFVTGSHDTPNFFGFSMQGVLATFLGSNLSVSSSVSFESTNSEHVGVSAVYDASQDRIYLMSNNSAAHNPQITNIDNVSSSPSLGSHYYLALDPSFGSTNAAGFELRASNNNSNNLVAAGYFRTHDFGGAPLSNATAWLTEFEKVGSGHIQTILYDAPSTNFHAHGGGTFSTFSGEHPYIFNQEIFTDRADGNGYVYLAPRLFNGNFAVDIVSTDWDPDYNNCLQNMTWQPYTITDQSIATSDDLAVINEDPVGVDCNEEFSKVFEECEVYNKFGETQTEVANAFDGMTVYPNPTSDVININIPNANATGELVVMNALGKVVFSTNVLGDDEPVNFDLSNQQSGLYFVIYTDNSQRMVSKVMKR